MFALDAQQPETNRGWQQSYCGFSLLPRSLISRFGDGLHGYIQWFLEILGEIPFRDSYFGQ